MDRDKVNEEDMVQLESALVTQPAVAMEDEPQESLVNDAIRFAEQEEASQARVSLHERDEVYLRGKQAIQERETKINGEIQIARHQIHEGQPLQDISSRKNSEHDKLASEMKSIQQELDDVRSEPRDYSAYVESKVEKMKYNLKVEESFVSQWRMETRTLKMRTSRAVYKMNCILQNILLRAETSVVKDERY